MVSAGEVTACPIVRGSVNILWSLPPGSVLSPKKWISWNVSFSKCFKQCVLSQPSGNTSKLICPPSKVTPLWHNWKQPVSKMNKWSKYYIHYCTVSCYYNLSCLRILIPMFQPFVAASHKSGWKHVAGDSAMSKPSSGCTATWGTVHNVYIINIQ